MNESVTQPELDTLLAIYRHTQANNYPPSMRELMRMTASSSLSVVSHRVNRLVVKGMLSKERGRSRSLCLCPPAYPVLNRYGYLMDESDGLFDTRQDAAVRIVKLEAEVKRLRRLLVQADDVR